MGMQQAGPDNRHYHFDIFANYHQIYLEDCALRLARQQRAVLNGLDPAHKGEEHADWIVALLSKTAYERHLGVAHGTLCILTARNWTVPFEVEIRPMSPEPDGRELASWDQVLEANLELPSGCLEVAGILDEQGPHRLQLPPGNYRARIHYGGVYTVSGDEFDGEDHYRVALWPDSAPLQQPLMLHTRGSGIW